MKARFVYESINFERGQDPMKTLGLGKRVQIEKWVDALDIRSDRYVINKDLSIIVNGDLFLRYTNITSLPDNLTVKGSLFLYNTNITSLPDNLTVNGFLNLKDTNISSLPDNLTIKGEIYKDF